MATELIAGLLFAAAYDIPFEVTMQLSNEEWANLIDGEHDLYLIAIGEADLRRHRAVLVGA